MYIYVYIKYPTLGKEKSSTEKCRLVGDLLVPWRVHNTARVQSGTSLSYLFEEPAFSFFQNIKGETIDVVVAAGSSLDLHPPRKLT